MFAIAARRMGYRVHALDPVADCPAGQVADLELNVAYDDVDAAVAFASGVDVVTFEFENVPAETLDAVAAVRPVRPSPDVLHTCRHRLREKKFLQDNGFPHADWREVGNAVELREAASELEGGILKTALFGYDGKGQQSLPTELDQPAADEVWTRLGQPTGVVERRVPFDAEISVIVARGLDGHMEAYPVFQNEHANHILDVTRCPCNEVVPPNVRRHAVALAQAITERLEVVGLLTVEMFVAGEAVLVNELAPRPHNSGHLTFDACVTSQFEQQLRAVCGLPLGDPALLCEQAAMANLLGDLWAHAEPRWQAAMTDPAVKLHLYGKLEPRPGRKMGHLTACGTDAHTTVRHARRMLGASGSD
jgi:5-(carboxyamino)imidazole ribonucleotide synthase